MSKSTLATEFIKIGQSGPTIDGRIIDPAWLLQAAEAYKPETYVALIWPDHFRFMNYGKVLELKAEEEGGVVSLYARLQPNANYVWDNQYGQRLFFSMEIDDNFAGTGKAYLVGLGITDSPASLGTSELKFSARRNSPRSVFLANVECAFPPAEDREPTWFTRFRKKLTPNTPDEETMDKKQFEALQSRVEELGAAVSEIKTSVAAFTAKPEEPKPEESKKPEAPETKSFVELTDAVIKLGAQVSAIAARFESAKPGTPVPPGEGPAEELAPLY